MPKAFLPLLFVLATLFAGCAPETAREASDSTVEILPTRDDDANYLVLFLNRQTLLYNGDLAADRISVTASRLKNMGCREPRLLREQAEPQSGSWRFGRSRILYVSEWKCV
jgi:hypothetical protein